MLHDWSDEDAVELLRNAARRLPADGHVIVVEGERAVRPRDGIAARTDLLMLLVTSGGQERTTAEIAALASRAGLRHRRRATLASGDRAHVCTSD